MKYFKKNWKRILCIALVCVISLGVLGGVASFATKDTKTISASAFSRGGLDENGKYVNTDKSLYTEEAFECIGLRVEPNFEANLTYDVYYYDYSNRLIESKLGLTDVYDEDFPLAKTCRIVIHPEIPADVKEKDFKIGFFDVYKIAKQLTITVNKNQEYLYSESVNYYVEENATQGMKLAVEGEKVLTFEDVNMKISEEIAVTDKYEKYDIFVCCPNATTATSLGVVATSADVVVYESFYEMEDLEAGEWCKLSVEIEDFEEADYIRVSIPKDATCYIFGYND